MSTFPVGRTEASNDWDQRGSRGFPWLLISLIPGAILAGAWSGSCRAEDRPVIENSIGMKLVSIPAGEFLMGANEKEGSSERRYLERSLPEARENNKPLAKFNELKIELLDSELPQHRVVITKAFFLGKYEVTQKEFSAVTGWNPSFYSAVGSREDLKERVAGLDTSLYPVDGVSWDAAAEFCRQLSALPEEAAAGRTYRLPTEAEWEYACRAGTTTAWHWGRTCGPKNELLQEYSWGKSVAIEI
jgi:formylglycine-generating enzyme required for sulfatase activity